MFTLSELNEDAAYKRGVAGQKMATGSANNGKINLLSNKSRKKRVSGWDFASNLLSFVNKTCHKAGSTLLVLEIIYEKMASIARLRIKQPRYSFDICFVNDDEKASFQNSV